MKLNASNITPPLRNLIEALHLRNTLQNRIDAIRNAHLVADDFMEYQNFSDATYSRNLIYDCDDFQMLLLCWRGDQESPVHDHGASDCVFRCISGSFEERRYHLVDNDSSPRLSSARYLLPGKVTHINNRSGFHQIRNSNAGNSLSLHFYAPPLERSRAYCGIIKSWRDTQGELASRYGTPTRSEVISP